MVHNLDKEHHKWMYYLTFAVILVIFGLVIYQVVMQERKVDQYYLSIILEPKGHDVTTAGLPTFPSGASGTLNGGIEQVREAVATSVNDRFGQNLNVPHWSKWALNIVPSIDPTGGSLTNVSYHYTFPVSSDMMADTEFVLTNILVSTETVADLFSNTTGDAPGWADDVFGTTVQGALTFGTYGTGSTAQFAI